MMMGRDRKAFRNTSGLDSGVVRRILSFVMPKNVDRKDADGLGEKDSARSRWTLLWLQAAPAHRCPRRSGVPDEAPSLPIRAARGTSALACGSRGSWGLLSPPPIPPIVPTAHPHR